MTQNKAQKTSIRQRMAETGEPYSVARHAVEREQEEAADGTEQRAAEEWEAESGVRERADAARERVEAAQRRFGAAQRVLERGHRRRSARGRERRGQASHQQ